MTEETVDSGEVTYISFAEFLEGVSPSSMAHINDLAERNKFTRGGLRGYYLRKPEIQLHCSYESCNGTRFFRCTTQGEIELKHTTYKNEYITYICSNCRKSNKTFSIRAKLEENEVVGTCYKYGEIPMYGPPTSAKLIKLIGPDRDIFLKGRSCENQGLGVGAFVYYRRVVENQKNRILDEIIKVSEKLSAPAAQIQLLKDAKKETQFSKALSSVKYALPQALLMNGQNPLTLLHSALSEGLHNQTDEYCLETAHSIRVLLGELSERLGQALKDEAELNNAITNLKRQKPAKGNTPKQKNLQ